MAPYGAVILSQYGVGKQGNDSDAEHCQVLRQPRGISVVSDGSLLVADFAAHCVFQFKAGGDVKGRVIAGEEGKCLPTVDPLKDIDRPMGAPDGEGFLLKRPLDVCADGEGGVYVVDAEDCRVQRFDLSSKGSSATIAVPPPGAPPQKSLHYPESIKNPRGLLIAPDGDLVLCDSWSHRVLRFAPAGKEPPGKPELLAGSANSSGARADQLAFPSCAAFDLDGSLLVADTNNHRVQRFAPGETSGTTVAGSADGQRGTSLGELDMPTGICVDARDGSLLVADRCNARLLRFPHGSRAGEVGEVVLGSDVLTRPWGICLNTAGEVFVSDERRGMVLQFSLEPLSAGAGFAGAVAKPAAKAQASDAAQQPAEKASLAFSPPARTAIVSDAMGLD